MNDCLIISNWGNQDVIRWPLDVQRQMDIGGEVIISNIRSLGLAMDSEGFLYVSDYDKHKVRRYRLDDKREGRIVAGGNGDGHRLNQLNHPRCIFFLTMIRR